MMTFDASTLDFAGGVVALASGFFLLLHWWQARGDRAALWWGAASCDLGVGLILLALQAILPAYASTVVGPSILDVCAAWTWAASRVFNRGSIEPRPLVVAVGVWIAMLIVSGATGHARFAAGFGLTVSACLYSAGAVEFWSSRSERLRGRWPMISLLSMYAISVFLVAVDASLFRPIWQTPSTSWLGSVRFLGLIYAAGSAISLVTMLKDRSEIRHKAAALVDPLTGLANRRAFMDSAQLIFERREREATPISLLAFDLDRFKRINDTFGHPVGDHALVIFAAVLSRAARPADIAARIGGEEFALVLPGCSSDAALGLARRIQSAFQKDARFVNRQAVNATVSVGVATTPEHGVSLVDIIASADHALYRAKDLGRNRVNLAVHKHPDPDAVTRIA